MGVKVTFIDGTHREFNDATDAIQSGAFIAVTKDATELKRFDFASVVVAVVDKDSGPKIVKGGGRLDK